MGNNLFIAAIVIAVVVLLVDWFWRRIREVHGSLMWAIGASRQEGRDENP